MFFVADIAASLSRGIQMGEITVPADSTNDSSQHLLFHDIAVDSMANPSVLRIHLKQSKTDQYHRDIDILVGPT